MQVSNFSGVSYANSVYNCDIAAMNTVITNYNIANSTQYPIWDTIGNDFEKFIHFLTVYCKVQELLKTNDTYNVKVSSVTPSNQVFGSRGALSSRVISIAFPFSNESQVYGDMDSLG